MVSGFKFMFSGGVKFALMLGLLALFSAQATAAEEDDTAEKWRMVWAGNFGKDDLPHEALAPDLEKFINSVTIDTEIIDGQLTLTAASAGCNGLRRKTYRRMVTPQQVIETIKDGKPYRKIIPATYEQHSAWSQTAVGCSLARRVDGKAYVLDWPMTMEAFIKSQRETAVLKRENDALSWVGGSGEVVARFEKLSDIFAGNQYWNLDPAYHAGDPILKKYFGPAGILASFPQLRTTRACGRFHAPIELTNGDFKLSGEINSAPCEGFHYLLNGQAAPYTPSADSAELLLARVVPDVTRYSVTGTGDTKRLTLSDENGRAVLHLIRSKEGYLAPNDIGNRIYERLNDNDWIIDPTGNLSADILKTVNPIRVVRHAGSYIGGLKKGPKTDASLISGQGCAIQKFLVDGKAQRMGVRAPTPLLKAYPPCSGEAITELREAWRPSRHMLFDDDNLVFYDEDWTEIMRARRGAAVEAVED